MSNNIKTWYDFVLQQMAAESYLQNVDRTATSEDILATINGVRDDFRKIS